MSFCSEAHPDFLLPISGSVRKADIANVGRGCLLNLELLSHAGVGEKFVSLMIYTLCVSFLGGGSQSRYELVGLDNQDHCYSPQPTKHLTLPWNCNLESWSPCPRDAA